MPNKGYTWKQAMWRMSNGKSVMQFCKETGACYGTIWNYVVKDKITVDEACNKALERKGNRDGATKYFVNGISLRQYCSKNGLNYQTLCRQKRKEQTDEPQS